jgi:hypothetical protein
VLLAGESPTDGVHRQQFARAIQIRSRIEQLLKNAPSGQRATAETDQTLHILGTTYSGSLHTLQLAVDELSKGGKPFELVSGTVKDRPSIDGFNAGKACPRADAGCLRTLAIDSRTALTAFRNYVRGAWNYYGRIAVLSESDTVFGDNPDPGAGFFLIPFPRDVSHLRNAYQSDPELSGFGQSSPDPRQRRNLLLPLGDTENTIDTIPEFAAQSVVSQETLFSQIANRVKHEHIEFAGIVASDVLDALFLTRFLRAAVPDIRLFVINPDLLFVHSADSLPFEGVLAVNTYWLLDGNPPFGEEWQCSGPNPPAASPPPDKHWMFPSPLQQGIHNAMRVLLTGMSGKPVPPLPGYESVEPGGKTPALWITSVGRESFVPIAALNTSPEYSPEAPTPQSACVAGVPPRQSALIDVPNGTAPLRSRQPQRPSRLWSILFLVATAALVALALVFSRAQRQPRIAPASRSGAQRAWLNDFRIQGRTGNRLRLGLVLVVASGIYLIVASTEAGSMFGHPLYRLASSPLASVLAAFGCGAIALMGWIWWWKVDLPLPPKLWLVLIAICVFAVPAWLAVLASRTADLSGLFFRFRAVEVSAGAAPTVPFLFLLGGFLVCSFVNLQRCIFHHQRLPLLPRGDLDPVLGTNVYREAKRLRRTIFDPFRYSPYWNIGLAVLVFALCFWSLGVCGLRSFEGAVYDYLLKAWAAALAAALAVVCGRFRESWRLLSRILDQLETHPIRRALSALPPDHSWSPIWQSNPSKRSYRIWTRSIDCLAAFRAAAPAMPQLTALIENADSRPRLTALIDDADYRVYAILALVARGDRETQAQHRAAESALARTANRLLLYLLPVWQLGGSESLDGSADPPAAHDDQRPPLLYASEFVAMRYLAFIRYAMLQLKNMLTFLMMGFLAFAFALMSYPFAGERSIAWVIAVLFLGLSLVVVPVFAQMGADAMLGRITSRSGGQLGFDFLQRALAFGVLPLLTVLASTFNGVGRFLFSWIEPALKTLH